MRRLHKTIQCTYFCVCLSEAINGQSLIIMNQMIQTKYSATNRCEKNHIYNNLYGLIKESDPQVRTLRPNNVKIR